MVVTLLHIATGGLALVAGAVAFYAAKGAPLHRRAGRVFVATMLTMSATGALMAAINRSGLSVIAGCLTFYLVASAFLTVQPSRSPWHRFTVWLMLFGIVVGASGMYLGVGALVGGPGAAHSERAPVLVVFASVALIAALLDIRALRGGLTGKARLIRHLWRMGFACFMAAASFFLGQMQVFPEPVRNPLLLAVPVLGVIFLTAYWLIRVQWLGQKRSVTAVG